MPQVINTNMASLNAQRNLNASQSQANTALERLSSGLRINSAKDDAAGLAISERFQSQISGLNQAQRNANDGISLAQTAEGAMDEITNNLQRIRELAVQAANATNSISDRQALNQEVQQRVEEINRIASQTSFNGLKVLDGTFGTQTFQVGANSGETIGISGLDSRGGQIGSVLKETDGLSGHILGSVNISELDFGTDITADITLDGEDLGLGTASYPDAEAFVGAINTAIGTTTLEGVEAALSDNGKSIVFSNTSGAEVPADISISDGTGTQEVVAGNAIEPLGSATFIPGESELISSTNISSLDLTTETTVNFSYADGAGDSGTVTVTMPADANNPGILANSINTQLQDDGLGSKFEAVADAGVIYIQNKTETDYDFTGVGGSDNAGNTFTTGDFSLLSGTIADQTEALTGDISALDFEAGVTGSLDIGTETVNFELDAATGNTINDLANEVTNALSADYPDLTVTVSGGNSLQIENSNTGTTYSITNFTAADGGVPDNSVATTDPIADGEQVTLADQFRDGESYDFNVNINGEDYAFKDMTSLNDIVSQINAKSNETGIQANLNRRNDEIYFSSQFNEPFTVNIQADFDGNGSFDKATETVQSVTATVENGTTTMDGIDISTAEGADIAMIAIDYAIDTINGFRAELGAVQNRFESTIANLSTTSENLSASNSRIRDADFAAETAELARTQVLQSAGLSVLAQANARPQQVLQLLQG